MAFFVDPFSWGPSMSMGPAGLFGAVAGAPRCYAAEAPGAFYTPAQRGGYVQPGRHQQPAGRRPAAANPLSAFYHPGAGVILRGTRPHHHQQQAHHHHHHHHPEAFYDASSEADDDTGSEYSEEEAPYYQDADEATFEPAPATTTHQARPVGCGSAPAAAANATCSSGSSNRSSSSRGGGSWGGPVPVWAASPGRLHAPAVAHFRPFAAAACAGDAPCQHAKQQQRRNTTIRPPAARQPPPPPPQQQQQQQQQQQYCWQSRPAVHAHKPAPPMPEPAAAANKGGVRQIPVQGGGAHHASTQQQPPPPPQQQPLKQQQQQQAPKHPMPPQSSAPQPARPSRQLTPAQAATVIQSWWRMRRLAQQHDALLALIAASTALREVESKFKDAKGRAAAAAPHEAAAALPRPAISHHEYLALNELAMRVLLQLDALPCGVQELRAVRKRLAANAMALLDRVQQAFNTGMTASMELPMVAAPSAQPQQQLKEEQEEDEQQLKEDQDQEQQLTEEPVSSSACDDDDDDADDADEGQAVDGAAVVVRLVYPGKLCEASTQTD